MEPVQFPDTYGDFHVSGAKRVSLVDIFISFLLWFEGILKLE